MRSPLSAMSAHFLRQELIPSDYLRQATCVTLGIRLNFDATQYFAAKRRTQQVLYEVTSSVCFVATATQQDLSGSVSTASLPVASLSNVKSDSRSDVGAAGFC